MSVFRGRIQPVDATPLPSNLARWNGMHIRGMHEHGSRQSKRLSSGALKERPMGSGRRPSARGTGAVSKILALNRAVELTGAFQPRDAKQFVSRNIALNPLAASCAGIRDLRSAEASVVRRPGDQRAKAPQVASEGRDRAPAVRTLPRCVQRARGGKHRLLLTDNPTNKNPRPKPGWTVRRGSFICRQLPATRCAGFGHRHSHSIVPAGCIQQPRNVLQYLPRHAWQLGDVHRDKERLVAR
jgi:hypothetical protein